MGIACQLTSHWPSIQDFLAYKQTSHRTSDCTPHRISGKASPSTISQTISNHLHLATLHSFHTKYLPRFQHWISEAVTDSQGFPEPSLPPRSQLLPTSLYIFYPSTSIFLVFQHRCLRHLVVSSITSTGSFPASSGLNHLNCQFFTPKKKRSLPSLHR